MESALAETGGGGIKYLAATDGGALWVVVAFFSHKALLCPRECTLSNYNVL